MDKIYKDMKLMIIGINSSHIKDTRTGIAMVATINDSFTNFYNNHDIIEEKNNNHICFCISSFISAAFASYRNYNKEYPKTIVIYRQGVSLHQKNYLKLEIEQIDSFCESHNIFYYYILVKKK